MAKNRCRKINSGRHTLEMRTNGTKHDIPNTNHLREKGRKEGVQRVHNQREKAKLLNLLTIVAWHDHVLASLPFSLPPRRSCPSFMRPRSICVHAKAKTRKPTDKQWKETA